MPEPTIHDTTDHYGEVVERHRVGPHEMVRYDTGEVRFRCVCRVMPDDGSLVIGALDVSSHTVTWHEGHPPNVTPSVLFDNPGPGGVHGHGFVNAGQWDPCGDDRSVPLPEGAPDDT